MTTTSASASAKTETVSDADYEVACVLMRRCLFYFVCTAFSRLHGGEVLKPLPYLKCFCFHLEQTLLGGKHRLVTCMPPRHLKSFILTCFEAWALGRYPGLKMLVVSYGDELARNHTEKFRTILHSDWYAEIFPEVAIARTGDRQEETQTTAGGMRRSATTGGALTGFGGQLIITDDLAKAQDVNSEALRDKTWQFPDNVLFSRFNNPETSIFIASQQRLHAGDLIARLLELPDITRLILPSVATVEQRFPTYDGVWVRAPGDLLDPYRFPQRALDEIKLRNAHVYQTQYQSDPLSAGSSYIDVNKMDFVAEAPPRHEHEVAVQFWDTSYGGSESDYSVGICVVFSRRRWWLVDMMRGRFEFPALKEFVVRFAAKWSAYEVLIENAGPGGSLVQQLRHEQHANIRTMTVSDPKEVRLYSQSALLQSQRFAVVRGEAWSDILRAELAVFPHGRNDDTVDALTLAGDYINRHGERVVRTVRNGGNRVRPLGRGQAHPSIYGDGSEELGAH
jgi:predicted phage terminase large subunit-like protein